MERAHPAAEAATGPAPDGAAPDGPAPEGADHGVGSTGRLVGAVLLYVGTRLLLIAALAGVLLLAGVPLLVSLLLAIIISLPLSLFAFRGLRTRVNLEVEAATAGRRERRERLRAELRGDDEG